MPPPHAGSTRRHWGFIQTAQELCSSWWEPVQPYAQVSGWPSIRDCPTKASRVGKRMGVEGWWCPAPRSPVPIAMGCCAEHSTFLFSAPTPGSECKLMLSCCSQAPGAFPRLHPAPRGGSHRGHRATCPPTGHADALELPDLIQAGGIILAGVGEALVDIYFTARAGVALQTLALEGALGVDAFPCVLAWVGSCKTQELLPGRAPSCSELPPLLHEGLAQGTHPASTRPRPGCRLAPCTPRDTCRWLCR